MYVFDEGHIALNSKSENHPYNRTPDYSWYTVESRYSGTTGTQLAVLYGEAPLIQRYVDLYTALRGWASNSVLIKEVSPVQSVLYTEIPL